MDRLSPLDTLFLEAEDGDPHTSMAIASAAVFEGPAPTYDEFVTAIRGRLPLVPRYRQKVRRVPLDLGAPGWVDDPSFDLLWHVRQTAVPPPGGDEQLARLMSRVMSARLDRDRPLWEYWLVHGLADGHWALVSKVHHCMVDGVSGTDLYRALFDTSPVPADPLPDDWQPVPAPSTLGLTLEAVRDLAVNPLAQVRDGVKALRTPVGTALRVVETARGLARLSGALVPAHSSSLTGPIGRQRRFTWARASMDDVRTVRGALGGTVNDVVLAVIAGAFRALLLHRGEQPGPHTIRSLVPVSVRAPGEEGIYEIRVSAMLAFLPAYVEDPVERLAAVRTHLAGLKASGEAEAGEAVSAIARHEPFPLVSLPLRLAFRSPQHSIVTVTTNVPGPRRPLYGLGRRLVEIVPYVPVSSTLRVGVSVLTYCDRMTFGVTGDYDTAPDVEVLARGIEDSLADLVKAAERTAGR